MKPITKAQVWPTLNPALSIILHCLPRCTDLFPTGLADYFDFFPLWPLSPLLEKVSGFWYWSLALEPHTTNRSLGSDTGLDLEEGLYLILVNSCMRLMTSVIAPAEWAPFPNNHYPMAKHAGSTHRLTEHTCLPALPAQGKQPATGELGPGSSMEERKQGQKNIEKQLL